MLIRPDTLVLDAVERRSLRAAAGVRREMKRGVGSLATVASVAPWLGLLLTLRGVVFSFVGCGGERSFCMAVLANNLSESLIPIAWGLAVAIPALWFYKYLSARLQDFDVEMEGATADLVSCLQICLARRR